MRSDGDLARWHVHGAADALSALLRERLVECRRWDQRQRVEPHHAEVGIAQHGLCAGWQACFPGGVEVEGARDCGCLNASGERHLRAVWWERAAVYGQRE